MEMDDVDLPHRLIAHGEEPLGERVNVYYKMKTLNGIIDALDEEERSFIAETPLGRLLEFPNKPAWSASFGLFLLGRQLEISKPNEIWIVYAGYPVRFSFREFKLVTGLRCDKYPTTQKTKKKGTAGKKIPFYSTLFGLEEDVTVERVITMLKKKIVTDPEMRRRYVCLALVDGFLLPTSHYPKIVKDHAEMAENLDAFISYPWGRVSFEMMMKSIKERDVQQLATSCVAVQGLLWALQLVVLEAAPSIQEGSFVEEVGTTESDDDVDVEIAPKQIPMKLGNAKDLDNKCQIPVDPIICLGIENDELEEDLSWTDDEEDVRVDNMVRLAEQGFEFSNEMFKGGCIPTQMEVAQKKQKMATKPKAVRGRKAPKTARATAGVRRNQRSPSVEDVEDTIVDDHAVSRMLDSKLAGLEERIVTRIIDWFVKNTIVDRVNEGEDGGVDKGVGGVGVRSSAFTQERATKRRVSDAQPVDLNDEGGCSSPSTHQRTDNERNSGRVDGVANAPSKDLPDVRSHSPLPPTPPRDLADAVLDEVLEAYNVDTRERLEDVASEFGMDHEANGTDVRKPPDGNGGTALDSEAKSLPLLHKASQIAPGASLPPETNEFLEVATSASLPQESATIGARRSKRPRTFSTKLDGRYHYDKKTKLLVGAKLPIMTEANDVSDLEERFQNSLQKLKGRSSISLGGEISLSNKDILDIVERKKHLGPKVMDALIRFSRHLLRTDDVDGERLRVDVLDSKFVSQLSRFYPKFSKCPSGDIFQFPKTLIDLIVGGGDEVRAQLFTEADCLYFPFNFDKKHWVALCVDLLAAKFIVLDCNVQLRKDSVILADLQHLAVMLPFLLKQAAANSAMSNLGTSPFVIERPFRLPQVTAMQDSGIMSIFLIHAHAAGGIEECVDFDLQSLESEAKKLVSAIILAGVP